MFYGDPDNSLDRHVSLEADHPKLEPRSFRPKGYVICWLVMQGLFGFATSALDDLAGRLWAASVPVYIQTISWKTHTIISLRRTYFASVQLQN